jgi:hypothetical protein
MSIESFQDRLTERVPVHHHALLTYEGRPTFAVSVTDISAGGFKGQCPDPVPVGERFMLDLGPAGLFAVKVCWSLGEYVGGEFLEPLSWGRLFTVLVAMQTGEEAVYFGQSPLVLV